MQAIQSIKQIPTCAWGRVKSMTDTTKNWFYQYKPDFDLSKKEFWEKSGKPFCDRNIKPLKDGGDYIYLTASVLTAALVTIVTYNLFITYFPIVMVFNALLVFGAFKYSQSRVKMPYNEKAWDHLDEIRKAVNNSIPCDQKIKEISEARKELMQPEFAHLKDTLKSLDEEIDKVKFAISRKSFDETKTKINQDFIHLKNTYKNEEKLFTDLETEVNKIGTDQLDISLLENERLKLVNTKNRDVQELLKNINDLIELARFPKLDQIKQACIDYLESKQKEIASYKVIQKLVPRQGVIQSNQQQSNSQVSNPVSNVNVNPPNQVVSSQPQSQENPQPDQQSPTHDQANNNSALNTNSQNLIIEVKEVSNTATPV